MNPILFSIGKIKITYYGLMYAISFILGIELGKKYGKQRGVSPDTVENYAFVAMLSGLIGGRLYYVLFNLDYYLAYPQDIIAVWKEGNGYPRRNSGELLELVSMEKLKSLTLFFLGILATAPLLLGQAISRMETL